jgi:uncharacterized protein YgiM (DUF1202 family)
MKKFGEIKTLKTTLILNCFFLAVSCKTVNKENMSQVNAKFQGTSAALCASSVNLRDMPSTNSKILRNLDRSDRIKLISIQNDWVYVSNYSQQRGQKKGWIHSPLLCLSEVQLKKAMSFNTPEIKDLYKSKVCATELTIRKEPSTSSKSIGYLEKGSNVKILSKIDQTWSKVDTAKGIGYVSHKYVCNTNSQKTPEEIPESIASYKTVGTAYYPYNNAMEGGFYDRIGEPLTTLEDFLDGKVGYVSVAMDKKAFKYGTFFRIPELEKKYNRVILFKVVDTGSAFFGKGSSRIDICVSNEKASYNKTVNGPLTLKRINKID